MKRQSAKAARVASARREMWQRMGPVTCSRCHQRRATDLHEPLCRSRGGDPSDPAQCWPVCRECHDWIHDHPALATQEGWLIPSWEGSNDAA